MPADERVRAGAHRVVSPPGEPDPMPKRTWRLVTRDPSGELVIRDFDSAEAIQRSHLQIGTDDCSTDLDLRGEPVFRTLVGPMPEGRDIVRYETPEVFETITKEWSMPRPPRQRVRRSVAKRPVDGGSDVIG